jgi:hypothetical protein
MLKDEVVEEVYLMSFVVVGGAKKTFGFYIRLFAYDSSNKTRFYFVDTHGGERSNHIGGIGPWKVSGLGLLIISPSALFNSSKHLGPDRRAIELLKDRTNIEGELIELILKVSLDLSFELSLHVRIEHGRHRGFKL